MPAMNDAHAQAAIPSSIAFGRSQRGKDNDKGQSNAILEALVHELRIFTHAPGN